jgi:hypothetical protein
MQATRASTSHFGHSPSGRVSRPAVHAAVSNRLLSKKLRAVAESGKGTARRAEFVSLRARRPRLARNNLLVGRIDIGASGRNSPDALLRGFHARLSHKVP